MAYLTKEPAAFVTAAVFLFALLRGERRLAFGLAAGAACIVGAEMAWYWSQSGDLLFRPHAMGVNNQDAMVLADNASLSWRLTRAYPRMMLVPSVHFGLHSLTALLLAAVVLVRKRDPSTLFLALLAAIPWLYLNFGTSNFRSYLALAAAPRYIAIVYVPLFILSASGLADWMGKWPRRRAAVTVLVGIVGIVGIGCAFSTRRTGYWTSDVAVLKTITTETRASGVRICEFSGPAAWRRALVVIAPDVIGCPGLTLIPDSRGLPVASEGSGDTPLGAALRFCTN